ncbi:hypothetical protein [Streptomyces sp. N35]|uniref:hypothetical protein n=1 Tax=Streptomyces sp. N35 TaxID=2795730 RepID=UPI0018F2D940|nr:hypothetical protein [Streptomyces sp. N35]
MNVPNTREDLIYHGVQLPSGGSVIEVESLDGQPRGIIAHIAYHSPTGMGWGYAGSGRGLCSLSADRRPWR